MIKDEVEYCKFSNEETRMFFQLIDRISPKETRIIELTSNKDLYQWSGLFEEEDAPECTIDKLWDRSICLSFSGMIYEALKKSSMSWISQGSDKHSFN